jgi:hypothetical protein
LGPEHVGSIKAVVLTDSVSVGKGKTHRIGKRKYLRRDCRGFYHARSKESEAWIELVADNIVPANYPKALLWFQLFRDIQVAQTLYHEIGHHLDETVGSATRRGEAAAEDWRKRLSRIHFQKRYWVLRPVVQIIRRIVRILQRPARRLTSR